MPAFVAGSAMERSRAKLLSRPAIATILRSEQTIEWLPGHLGGGPAKNSFRADIPVSDPTGKIQCDDREIDSAVEHRLITAGGPAHATLRPMCFRRVHFSRALRSLELPRITTRHFVAPKV